MSEVAGRIAREADDLLTLEVVGENLSAIVGEMRSTIIRTAYSPTIYESHDFSCVILDGEGLVVTKAAADSPAHIAPIPMSIQAVRRRYGSDIRAGDVFLHNDPYTGGTHLNDVAMIVPIFVEGALLCFAAVRAHWGDIGGMTPGSLSGQATEIYQEGIRIEAVRIYEGGTARDEILGLVFDNVRDEVLRRGDVQAALAGCAHAGVKIRDLVARRGIETLRATFAHLTASSRRRMEEGIRRLPDGTHAYEAYIESAGATGAPLLVNLRATVADGRVTADFSGSAPQSLGPTNVGPIVALSGVFTVVKAYCDPDSPYNSGAFQPLAVTVPDGTFLSARRPAAVGGFGEARRAVETAMMGVLSSVDPESAFGDHKGSGNHVYIGGLRRDASSFLYYEFPAAGAGAFNGGDGANATTGFSGGDFASIQPVETIESQSPVRVLRSELRLDSAGSGKWRGGLGLRRELEVLVDGAVLSILSDRNILAPHGVRGGHAGYGNRFVVYREGVLVEPSAVPGKVSGFRLRRGDIVCAESAGGGGFGDPLARASSSVAADVANGYLSLDHAARSYGVVIENGGVNEAATAERRSDLARSRSLIQLRENDEVEYRDGRRCILLTDAAARLVGVEAGDIVEVVNWGGSPLRAWVELIHRSGTYGHLSARGLLIAGIKDGDEAWVRPLAFSGNSGRRESRRQ